MTIRTLVLAAALTLAALGASPAAASPGPAPHEPDYGDPPAMLVGAVIGATLAPTVQTNYRGWRVTTARCRYRYGHERIHCRFVLSSGIAGTGADGWTTISWAPTIPVARDFGQPDLVQPDLSGSATLLGYRFVFPGPGLLPGRRTA